MKRFMQDLGDLTGLDIVGATRCVPVRCAETRPDPIQTGAAATLARGALRWLGLSGADDGRCRAVGPADTAPVAPPAPPLH